jgi:uncharacterized protein involved in exopolysaccharide biosynthesis
MSLLEIATILLRRRRTIVAITVASIVLMFLWLLFKTRTYTATATFVPQGQSASIPGARALAGLGLPISTDAPGESPQFYAELVKSREILRTLATQRYGIAKSALGDTTASQSLAAIVQPSGSDSLAQLSSLVAWLDNVIGVGVGRETGVVRVSVRTTSPGLSLALSQEVLQQVADFNLKRRQSRGGAERRFVEAQLTEALDSLRAAEDRAQRFLASNKQLLRGSNASSEQDFQYARLQRDIALRQQAYMGLVTAHQEARVTEVRNTPVITVVESPYFPLDPDPRRGALFLVIALVLGLGLAVFMVLAQEFLRRGRGGGVTYEEFADAWSQTWRPVTGLRRSVGSDQPRS